MKKILISLLLLISVSSMNAQQIRNLEQNKEINLCEYNLDNGLHVLLIQDTISPIVYVGVAYHVGSKNEKANKTGFAHLCEHLMFHGSKNIKEGEFDKYINEVGGRSNAYTSYDYTNYYEVLPANQVNLGIWLESERMLHPRITESGMRREIEVVKEESRQRYDGNALGRLPHVMMDYIFEKFPYKWPIIGSMENLNSASLDDFSNFFHSYYVPDNACFYIAGNFNIEETKKNIAKYFSAIPRSKKKIERPVYDEPIITKEQILEKEYEGLKQPHLFLSYQVAPDNTKEADVLKFIVTMINDNEAQDNISNTILKSKDMKDFSAAKKDSILAKMPISKISASGEFYESAGMVWVRASFNDSIGYRKALNTIDEYFYNIAKNGLNADDIQRLKMDYKNDYTNIYYNPSQFADMASLLYVQTGSINRIFEVPNIMSSITNEEIKAITKKYLCKDKRKVMVLRPMKKGPKVQSKTTSK